MANIKSAKKRIEVNAKKQLQNRVLKSNVKNTIKDVEKAITANDKELASKKLADCVSKLDKAASKGIVKQNFTSRQKSRLTLKVGNME